MLNKNITFGTGQTSAKKSYSKNKFSKIIDFCLDNEIKCYDTAKSYFSGETQSIIGNKIKKTKNRIKIIAKFDYVNDLKVLRKDLDASLKNIKRDYIDIYMPHWPTPDCNLNLLSDFANESIIKGKIRKFGLSNFNLPMIKRFKKYYKDKFALQFELNLSNFFFYKKLLNYCLKNKVEQYCYSIANNFPTNDSYLYIIKKKYNLNNYELSLKWLSKFKYLNPIIRSTNQKNIKNNLKVFTKKNILIKEDNINFKNFYKKINISNITELQSESGFVYNTINQAKKNKYNIYPSPESISLEIKKFGLLKPFFFRKIENGYMLLAGQARFWGYLMCNKKIKSIKGILVK